MKKVFEQEIYEGSCSRQILAAALANIPALVYGVMIGWVSAVLPLLQSSQTPSSAPLSDLVITLMASALPAAASVSTPLFGYCADLFGRKTSIMLLSVLFAISWSLKLVSAEPWSLITARMLAGVSAGGMFLVIPIYVREIAQDSVRGALGSIFMTFCNAGVLLVYTLGIYLSYRQCLSLYLLIPLVHLVVFFFMPETPAYCVKKHRYDEAANIIAWLRSLNVTDARVIKEVDKLKKEESLFAEIPSVSFLEIVKRKGTRSAIWLSAVMLLVQTWSGNFAVINYASNIFQRANTPWPAEYLGLIIGAVQLVGSLISICTIEKFGRKPLLLGSCLFIFMCMGTLGAWFLTMSLGVSSPGWLAVAAVCLSTCSYGLGLAGLPYVIMAEIFSFQDRARISGTVTGLSWLLSCSTVLLFMPLSSALGDSAVFFMFSGVCAFGSVYIALYMPETSGKSFQQIENDFQGGAPALTATQP